MGRTRIRTHARRALLALAIALCAAGIAAGTAQAAAPLAWTAPVHSDAAPGTLGVTAVSCQSLHALRGGRRRRQFPVQQRSGEWRVEPARLDQDRGRPPPDRRLVPVGRPVLRRRHDRQRLLHRDPGESDPMDQRRHRGHHPAERHLLPDDHAVRRGRQHRPRPGLDDTRNPDRRLVAGRSTSTAPPPSTAVSCPTRHVLRRRRQRRQDLLSATPTVLASWQATTLTHERPDRRLVQRLRPVRRGRGRRQRARHRQRGVRAAVTWSATPIDAAGAPLSAVSCTDAGLCVIVDHARQRARRATTPRPARPTWTATPIDTGHAARPPCRASRPASASRSTRSATRSPGRSPPPVGGDRHRHRLRRRRRRR